MARRSNFRQDLYAGTGSDVTSNTFFVGDFEDLSLQLIGGSTSTTTVQLSNATGFRESISEDDWSTATTVITTGDIVDIAEGPRWIRCLRTSDLSQAVIAGPGPY